MNSSKYEQPTIRIQNIVLDNFKGVEHGEITLNCGRKYVERGTEPDVLGIYGQNGSGKSSIIEALSILKCALSGLSILQTYVDCISATSKYAGLGFTFDLQYADGKKRTVNYSFKMQKVKRNSNVEFKTDFINQLADMVDRSEKIRIFDECLSMSGDFDGDKIKMQPIIDTADPQLMEPFHPNSKRRIFTVTEDEHTLIELYKIVLLEDMTSHAFAFSNDALAFYEQQGAQSEYLNVIKELKWFAKRNLLIVDTQYLGGLNSEYAMPLYGREDDAHVVMLDSIVNAVMNDVKEDADDADNENSEGDGETIIEEPLSGIPDILPMIGSFEVTKTKYDLLVKQFKNINIVLEQLIPGLSISLKALSGSFTKNGEEGVQAELFACRDGVNMPLRYESEGVKKLISVLDLIIRAYNQESVTIAIDELDSGIFEYLLGEILQVFQENGRGQFIFTSHNFRPLEVLDKKYLCFTTTNKKERYTRLKNIGRSNNLRDVYYREIKFGETDEKLYHSARSYDIAMAFRRAGYTNEGE